MSDAFEPEPFYEEEDKESKIKLSDIKPLDVWTIIETYFRDNPDNNIIREVYKNFKQLRKYADLSKDYFYEATDLEEEKNSETKNAISDMKSAINQMDTIFIPSIRETARAAGIELE